MCIGGWMVHCDDGAPNWFHCPYDGCLVQEAGPVICEPVPCLPDCFGRQCGDDGCGGSCGGYCPDGEICDDALRICLPGPGGCDALVGDGGAVCLGQVLAQCSDTWELQGLDCPSQGQVCGPVECDGPLGCRPLWPWLETCDGLPPWGVCRGDWLFSCDDGWLQATHCGSLGPYHCARTGLEAMDCALD